VLRDFETTSKRAIALPSLFFQRSVSINPTNPTHVIYPGRERYALHVRVAALPLADMPDLGDKDLIHEALRTLVSFKRRKDLTELAGKIDFTDDYNHKSLRKM
jgi:hypothetical protein